MFYCSYTRAISSVGRATPLHGEGRGFKSLIAHMNKRIECSITGRVQMVMYRDFTTRSARPLGITGKVRNMDDGSVLVVAEGEEEKLNILIAKLKEGSLFSRVLHVEVKWKNATGEFASFDIEY